MQSPVSNPLRTTFAWLAFAAWVGTIFYCSSLTGAQVAQFGVHLWDKMEHFVAFAVGGVLLALALRWSVTWPVRSVARLAIGILVAYGALDEIHQLFTLNRSGADPFDWMADCLGGVSGVSLLLLLYVRLNRAH